jgi:hypothetical protein
MKAESHKKIVKDEKEAGQVKFRLLTLFLRVLAAS